jgi:hypothetical protein
MAGQVTWLFKKPPSFPYNSNLLLKVFLFSMLEFT